MVFTENKHNEEGENDLVPAPQQFPSTQLSTVAMTNQK